MKWESWEVERLVEMWNKGATSGEIGEVIGRTGGQVRSYVKNNREKLGIEARDDDDIARPYYHADYYYLPKYHWLISKSWSEV